MKNYCATKIQSFYRKFIKCDRDAEVISKIKRRKIINNKERNTFVKIKSPIDPLYRIPYDEKYRIRIIEKPYGQPKYNVWHFNINSLIEWLNLSKEWINPMTNCLFLNKTQDFIMDFIENNKTKRKLKIKKIINKHEPGYKKKKLKPISYFDTTINKWNELVENVYTANKLNCLNFFNKHYDLIENDKIDLNADINKTIYLDKIGETLNPVGLIHLAVEKGSKEIVEQLIYFGCNLNKKCGNGGFNALHLCAINNNIEIAKVLIQYGIPLDDVCIYEDEICSVFELCENLQHYNFLNFLLTTIH